MNATDNQEIVPMTDESSAATEALIRAAMAFLNQSPAGKALAGSEFAAGLACGRGSMTLSVTMPRGPIRIFATHPEGDPVEIGGMPEVPLVRLSS